MHPMLNIALRAARKAGNLIIKNYETIGAVQKNNSSNIMNCNEAARAVIIDTIHKFYPKHTIITEENSDIINFNENVQWIIDPINSTINFLKLLPHFAVTIAVRIKGRTEIAIIYDPIRNELFTAIRGEGAQLNGYRLRGSSIVSKQYGIILATNLPILLKTKYQQHATTYIKIIGKIFSKYADFRKSGSSALDMAYVAAGRLDGYFDFGLKLLDFAAGELIAREAGAIVCDFTGGYNYIMSGNIVAGNPRIVKWILANINTSNLLT